MWDQRWWMAQNFTWASMDTASQSGGQADKQIISGHGNTTKWRRKYKMDANYGNIVKHSDD
jgi:hypothetical protein